MLTELKTSEFYIVANLFNTPHIQHVYYSLAAGNSHGRIWVDNSATPRSAFLWDLHASYIFCGAIDNAIYLNDLHELISREITPAQDSIVIAYYDSDNWVSVISDLFVNRNFVTAQRRLYHINELSNADWRDSVMTDVRIERITEQLVSKGLTNTELVMSEINQMWPSTARFFEQSVGYCAVHNGSIVSWCTGEYVYDSHIGIGIETVEDYQRKGLATAVASAFIEHCIQRNMSVHWDCWSRNLPSNMTAQKLGFTLTKVSDVQWALIE